MRTAKQIRKEIREIRAYMRENRIRKISCMNRLEQREYQPNARLFALSIELEQALKEENR